MRRKFINIPLLVFLALITMVSAVMVSSQLLSVQEQIPSTRISVSIPHASSMQAQQPVVVLLSYQQPAVLPEPGSSIHDGRQTWTTDTQVDIFKASYENEKGQVTVSSPYGDKLIAPGTANDYIFYIENTGDVSLDYTLTAKGEASFEKDGIHYTIPIQAKLSRSDGSYFLGSQAAWDSLEALNQINDQGTLAAGNHSKYTFSWQWPYETEDGDSLDTLLGNMSAAGDELRVTVTLNVVVSACDDPDQGGGTPPDTGDDARIGLWMTLAVVSFAAFVILLCLRRKDPGREK